MYSKIWNLNYVEGKTGIVGTNHYRLPTAHMRTLDWVFPNRMEDANIILKLK